MNWDHFALRTRHLGIATVGMFVGGLVTGQPVLAQPSPSTPPVSEIIVLAPRVVHREVVGSSTIGAPIEQITVSYRVIYTDLDLTKHSDAMELDKRIHDTAVKACKELADRYPEAQYPSASNENCVDVAVDRAMVTVKPLIAGASN